NTMSDEALKLAESAVYDAEAKEVIVTLKDGSRHAWPIRLLEMVQSTPDGWVLLENITEQQLVEVEVYGGGKYIMWDELGQVFKVSDLLTGVYGREDWMRSLMTAAA
ncbi:MAG: hypothetical protein AAFR25_07870, partial [Cyanobacteria bacterium J06629_19]